MDYSTYSQLPVDQTYDPLAMAAYWGFVFVVSILMIVALWKIFTKAGRPGWASLIPIYNTIVMLQIAGYSGWLVLLFFIPFINIIFIFMVYHRLAQAFGHGIGYTLGLFFLSPIFFLMLAFGKSTYTSPKGGTPTKPAATDAKTPVEAPAKTDAPAPAKTETPAQTPPVEAPAAKEEAPKQ